MYTKTFVDGLLTLIVFGIVAMFVILGLVFGAWLILSGHTVAGWIVSVIAAIILAFTVIL